MNQNKFLRIFSLFAFMAFMIISCWATVESLHLLLPDWPIPIFWIVTIGFFVLASLGSKLIVDSFNPNDYVPNKGWRFIGGIVLLALFWILFSLPTNAHTFFYKAVVKEVVQTELVFVKEKLEELADGGRAKIMVETEKNQFKKHVNNAFSNLQYEILDPNNSGYGPKAEKALLDLDKLLGSQLQKPKYVTSHEGRLKCVNSLKEQKDALLNAELERRDRDLEIKFSTKRKQNEIKSNIVFISQALHLLQTDSKKFFIPFKNKEGKIIDNLEQTKSILTKSLSSIREYSDSFKEIYPDNDAILGNDYQANGKKGQGIISKTERLENVIGVWKDFFAGKYAGRGFIFWIIIAALVDIGGFIFFDIAFKKRTDY